MALTRITQGVIKPNENYDTHNINSTGIITATGANISGNMSVGGVLTYEDVTNIDSVGLVTARSGIRIGGHILPTVNEAYDLGSADKKIRHLFLSDNSLKFVDSSDTEHPLSVDSGRLKFAGGMLLGNNIKLDAISGIITATNFAKADGSSLGGVQSDSSYNTLGGSGAGAQLTGSSLRNTFFGWDAGTAHQSGEKNTYVGAIAGKFQISSNYNTGFGDAALCQNSGSFNTGVGYQALAGESERLTMEHNVAIGYNALRKLDDPGDFNVAVGSRALENCVTGISNIAIGYQSLFTNSSGYDNIAIGASSGRLIDSGYENVLMGKNAGEDISSGRYMVCLGSEAGTNMTTAWKNVAIGWKAAHSLLAGDSNVLIGAEAGSSIQNSNDNVCIGREAGNNITTGLNNIVIGKQATASANNVQNEITLGYTGITKFRIPGLNITIDSNGISDAKGNLRSIPQQNEQGSTHTLVAADAGKHILADNTVTVPPTSGIFSAGDAITIVNAGSSNISIAKGSGVTLYNSADGSDTGRTLSAKGMATILCAGVNTYYISGAGLS